MAQRLRITEARMLLKLAINTLRLFARPPSLEFVTSAEIVRRQYSNHQYLHLRPLRDYDRGWLGQVVGDPL